MISLELMSEENSIDVYSFEKENREYFERSLPPRPAHYFDSESFKEITRELLREQENHDVYMHLIRDAQGVMVGRINLSVLGKDRKTAELGYRIGENVTKLSVDVFLNCSNLKSINYLGTMDEWNGTLGKTSSWRNGNTSIKKIICSDGEITL